ncbi:unnamed protein product [Nesidiocoris tenuis]|uniref:Peptidase S1 domain-containing protein n=1 Tax=Nesidiocoris tenuis TaxID=355587 RepID=A0A6H5H765_9HEMI|nr:unnamed protein product [Nesidiocoris tenuis]
MRRTSFRKQFLMEMLVPMFWVVGCVDWMPCGYGNVAHGPSVRSCLRTEVPARIALTTRDYCSLWPDEASNLLIGRTSYLPYCYRRWSTRPKDYYSANDLIIIAGRDDGDLAYCSQERPGDIVSAHPDYPKDPHQYNIAMMEVKSFDFNETALPIMPFLHSEKENVVALLKIQKEKPICDVPTFKPTKYLRNLLEDRESTAVEIVDADECWNKYCPRGHKGCLPFFDKKYFVCAQFVKPEKRCARHDIGAPLVCNNVTVGVMKICRENRPMLFQGFGDKMVESLLKYNDMGSALRLLKKEAEKLKKRKK